MVGDGDMDALGRITHGLALLRQRDGQYRLFGATRHRYELRPRCSLAMVERTEGQIGTQLPRGYRDFIVRAGDGGAGPYYGVESLEGSVDAWRRRHGDLEWLRQDFPLEDDVVFADEYGAPATWDEHARRLEEDPEYEAAVEGVISKYAGPGYRAGTLRICEYGCGDFFLLVVRGEGAGTVWADCVGSGTGLFSLRVDFLSWYETWLERSLERVSRVCSNAGGAYSFLEFGANPRYRREG